MRHSKSEIKKEIVDLYAEGSFLRNYIGLIENIFSSEEAEKRIQSQMTNDERIVRIPINTIENSILKKSVNIPVSNAPAT